VSMTFNAPSERLEDDSYAACEIKLLTVVDLLVRFFHWVTSWMTSQSLTGHTGPNLKRGYE